MKTKCMSCGGSMKKMAKGGMPSKTPILGPAKKPFAAGIPYFIGAGQTGPSSMKKGGSTKRKTTHTGAPKGMNPLVYFNSLKGKNKAEPKQNLRKAQDGFETENDMMINKPGSTGGYKAPVRPGIGYKVGKPGARTPETTRPVRPRPPMTRPDMINMGKDKNSPYYGASEQDLINKGVIPKNKKGGATKAAKFAALAPPYNKATFADRIVGAKKNAKKK